MRRLSDLAKSRPNMPEVVLPPSNNMFNGRWNIGFPEEVSGPGHWEFQTLGGVGSGSDEESARLNRRFRDELAVDRPWPTALQVHGVREEWPKANRHGVADPTNGINLIWVPDPIVRQQPVARLSSRVGNATNAGSQATRSGDDNRQNEQAAPVPHPQPSSSVPQTAKTHNDRSNPPRGKQRAATEQAIANTNPTGNQSNHRTASERPFRIGSQQRAVSTSELITTKHFQEEFDPESGRIWGWDLDERGPFKDSYQEAMDHGAAQARQEQVSGRKISLRARSGRASSTPLAQTQTAPRGACSNRQRARRSNISSRVSRSADALLSQVEEQDEQEDVAKEEDKQEGVVEDEDGDDEDQGK